MYFDVDSDRKNDQNQKNQMHYYCQLTIANANSIATATAIPIDALLHHNMIQA